MSIVLSDLSFRYPNESFLFEHLNLSVAAREKVSMVGANGTGKSTLLQVIAGWLPPSGGSVACSSKPYYVPQHTGAGVGDVAALLGIAPKIAALRAIERGSVAQSDYDTLGDDWEIEARSREALAAWGLGEIPFGFAAENLSGGERSRVLLAGLLLHDPQVVLLDEPTNHLDRRSRERLYEMLTRSTATTVVVSHDAELLELLDTTYELCPQGLARYGGNFSFYQSQKALRENALEESIHESEKSLRLAQRQEREARERQQKRTATQGQKNKMQVPRIMRNTLRDSAENTAARLGDKHNQIVAQSREKLSELRSRQQRQNELKINFDDSALHSGKLLAEAVGVDFSYPGGRWLWPEGLDFKLFSRDRIHILGDNGSGKTTLLRLLLGELAPTKGTLRRAEFSHLYLDQHYTQADTPETVSELAQRHNTAQLPLHEVNLRLNRFLFPKESWDRVCSTLSGGERMRLLLCCLTISNQMPDLIVLDEPTNNLDLQSLAILTDTIRDYRGSLLVISHDHRFAQQIGITEEFDLNPFSRPTEEG